VNLFTRQWYGKDVAWCDNGAPHCVHIADISDGGCMAGGDGFHGVPDLHDIGEVDSGEVVVGGVEADAGERDDELLARAERRVGVLGGEPVGGADLVGGGEAGEDDLGDGAERVGRPRGVADGDGLADAVGAGAAGGHAEGRPLGEDAVGGARRGEVERVGCQHRRRVGAEERRHLGHLHVRVERVAQQSRARVRASARLDRRLRRRAAERRRRRREEQQQRSRRRRHLGRPEGLGFGLEQ